MHTSEESLYFSLVADNIHYEQNITVLGYNIEVTGLRRSTYDQSVQFFLRIHKIK